MKLKYRLFQISVIFKIYFFKVLFFYKRKEAMNTFLISERGVDARDNGYSFYRYLIKNHPEIKVKYIISKDSSDINKINKENIVYYNSSKHYFYFLYSSYLISTHIMGFCPNTSIGMRLNGLNILPIRGKLIFLQHGITKDYSKLFDYSYTKLNLFSVASNKEKDFIEKANKYKEGIVKNIGFCRFDNLINEEDLINKKILIMPTRRYYHEYLTNEQFLNTIFYKKYQSLLNNSLLISYLEKNNYFLYFYLHHETQKFRELFKSNSQHIIICIKEDYDVQDLLKKCNYLITDYSSVYFDFAYMKKKIVYYHFDYDEYRSTHQEGFFSYLNDGFGPIIKEEKDIINIILNDFNIDKKYIERIDNFFTLKDNHNSERTFKEIINL